MQLCCIVWGWGSTAGEKSDNYGFITKTVKYILNEISFAARYAAEAARYAAAHNKNRLIKGLIKSFL
jgi:hypothetical protein